MFRHCGHIVKSDILLSDTVFHGFAKRSGGVSVIPEVASMNTAVRMGDTEENVSENIKRLASYAGLDGYNVVYSKQIHSTKILTVSQSDTLISSEEREYDGYVTDISGIALLVRAADCLPILFCGKKPDGSPVIGAAHAGWKGSVYGIAPLTVEKMCELGAVRNSIHVAIGPSVRECCFEVKEDFILSVISVAGAAFANRHIHSRDGKHFASLQDMNTELLETAGISREMIDISPDCTAHMSDIYHSHRATKGMRGTGGGIIGIKR